MIYLNMVRVTDPTMPGKATVATSTNAFSFLWVHSSHCTLFQRFQHRRCLVVIPAPWFQEADRIKIVGAIARPILVVRACIFPDNFRFPGNGVFRVYTKTPKVFTPKVFISEAFTKYLPPKNLASVHFSQLFIRGCVIDRVILREISKQTKQNCENGSKKAKKRWFTQIQVH